MNIIKYRLTSNVSHHELPFQLILHIHGVFILIFNTFLGAAFSLALNSFYFYFLFSNSIFTSLFTISNTTSNSTTSFFRILLTFMYCLSVSFAMTSLAYFSDAMNWGSVARFQGFHFSHFHSLQQLRTRCQSCFLGTLYWQYQESTIVIELLFFIGQDRVGKTSLKKTLETFSRHDPDP